MSPFEANNGFGLHTNRPEAGKRKHDNINSMELLEDWTSVWRELRDNLVKAQMR
jgi:hypothetical protein